MAAKKIQYPLSKETLEDIKSARNTKGWSQQKMADSIDKTRVTYVRFENGQCNVLSDTMQSVCYELELEPHVYVVPKGEPAVDIKELYALLRKKDQRIEELERQLAEKDQKIREQKETLDIIRNIQEMYGGKS